MAKCKLRCKTCDITIYEIDDEYYSQFIPGEELRNTIRYHSEFKNHLLEWSRS